MGTSFKTKASSVENLWGSHKPKLSCTRSNNLTAYRQSWGCIRSKVHHCRKMRAARQYSLHSISSDVPLRKPYKDTTSHANLLQHMICINPGMTSSNTWLSSYWPTKLVSLKGGNFRKDLFSKKASCRPPYLVSGAAQHRKKAYSNIHKPTTQTAVHHSFSSHLE